MIDMCEDCIYDRDLNEGDEIQIISSDWCKHNETENNKKLNGLLND